MKEEQPRWVTQGKSIRELIEELQTYEDQGLEVLISIDGGATLKPISLLGKAVVNNKVYCALKSFSEESLTSQR